MSRTITTVDLTIEQQKNVRAALNFLRHRFDWVNLGKLLHFNEANVRKCARGRRTISASMAFRIARLAQVGVDEVLTGKWPAPGTCPNCGHHDQNAAAK